MKIGILLTFLLAGCGNLPMKAEPGTSITRLSKITGNVQPAVIGGAHAETWQLVRINPTPGECIHMEQDNFEIDTCPEGGDE